MQIPSTRHHTIPAAMAACAAFLLSLGGLSSAASGNTPPPASALSQDEQALLKNKKYQQGLKDLAAHLPLPTKAQGGVFFCALSLPICHRDTNRQHTPSTLRGAFFVPAALY